MSHISVSGPEPLPDLLTYCPRDISSLKISVVIWRPVLTKLISRLFRKPCYPTFSKCRLHCLILMSGPSAKYIQNLTISSHLRSCHPGPVHSYGRLHHHSSLLSGLRAPYSLFLICSQRDTEYLYQGAFLSCPVPSCGSVSHRNCQCSFRGLCKAHDPCMIRPCYLSTCSFYPAHSAPATLASGPLHLTPFTWNTLLQVVEAHIHLL